MDVERGRGVSQSAINEVIKIENKSISGFRRMDEPGRPHNWNGEWRPRRNMIERLARGLYYYDTGESGMSLADLAIYKDGARHIMEFMDQLEVE